MPQRRNAIKALRINHKKHLRNLDIKTDLKKTIKKFKAALAAKEKKEAEATLKLLYKKIDKAAKRNLLHKNTAARRKSVFTRQLATV